MVKPLALRLGNRTSLTAVPPAHGGNCGGHVSPPFSFHSAGALSLGPADSIGGRSSSLPADAPVSVRVMNALKDLPPEGCLE